MQYRNPPRHARLAGLQFQGQRMCLAAGLAVLAGLSLAGGLRADEPPPAATAATSDGGSRPSVESFPALSADDQQIVDALDRRVTLEFGEQPLHEVVEFLDDMLDRRIAIQFDRRALEEAGIGTDTPITRSVRNITLKSALRLILAELDMDYVIQDGVLLLTTMDRAESSEYLATRVYPVGDLADDSFDSITDVISRSVLPNTWNEVGGNASIMPMPACQSIVVAQTLAGHDEVVALLRALRAAKKEAR